MITLIYGSSVTEYLSDQEVLDILTISRQNNQQQNITGVLIYSGKEFIQILEGEEDAVYSLFENIKRDPRHKNIRVYAQHPISKRQFERWGMGFINSPDLDLSRIPGYERSQHDTQFGLGNTISIMDVFTNLIADEQISETP